MAVTSIHAIKATVSSAIRYIIDENKTVNGLYVSSYACRPDSRGASEDFERIRQQGTGLTTILAHHIIQSFKLDEITPEKALQVSEELCERLLKGNHQYVLAVHSDKDHIHSHIIFNNTNLYNGLSFTTEHNQGKVKERSWAKLRQLSDEICKENGLSVIAQTKQSQGVSHYEWEQQKAGTSWKAKLRYEIDCIIQRCDTFGDFLEKCRLNDIEAVYTPEKKVSLKFRMKGQQRFTRAKTLGYYYLPENIERRIKQFSASRRLIIAVTRLTA